MKNDEVEKFSNKEIAHLLRSMAAAYLLTGVNRFRIIAYEKAADSIEHLTREVKDIWQEGKLFEIPGIGSAIGSHLEDYFRSRKSRHFDSILKKIPGSVFVLMKIPTIGPKKAYKLVRELKLLNSATVIEDLKQACTQGEVAKLETFGEKSEKDIVEAINLFEKKSAKIERMPLPYAFVIAKEIIDYLKKNPRVKRVDALGSLRRMVATIGDIDIAVQIKSHKVHQVQKVYKEIIDYFIKFPKKVKVDNAGEKKASIIVHPNIRVDLRVQDEKSYGSMLQYFTGSKPHNINLREYALKNGFSLSEYGIKPLKEVRSKKLEVGSYNKKSNIYEFNSEEKFYDFLGLQYIPPEIREGTNEIEGALRHRIPKLIQREDIKGDLHIHSSYNLKPSHDLGNNTYLEILKKASQLNYQYVGFADHNPKLSGLSSHQVIEIMKLRNQEINKIRKKSYKVKSFIGLEVDILPDGRISLPEGAIDYVDYLIVAIHSLFNLDLETMTNRVLRALSYPKVKILGHPTGRLLGKREGYELNWTKIFAACRQSNIAIEINSWPDRLDLPDLLVREGLTHKAKFMLNTDAHANSQLEGIFYGVSVAKRGWCKKNDIINTLSYEKFRNWILDIRY
ncbi:hypothetical protein A3C98_03640 [Candidatus Roizmanbacteria bacterium RIFCSPHIGHO2_02_FULL_37_15]|uniref:DNA-directed DNA polymerase n=1 Tax=Candidatus Roizmanbacteria bacterium RIFCSPLOWO2_01_FULL_37_16 TaxID=1802058 RepID=A0A1F7IP08_9BACT|nr:MAG: hypothetical protein A2859_05090 [Candidatus Roizmanbacteria bacterium RIFCSPHIGHO2_01_FULL_37_16b]OGK20461.1 MAG: hypothetical protein A3C98_03640 [Candidatus Roizmanbacteria bacterium RIFCSPHIGHO2_02_FULL_37_15]OGK31728.1 MAG: hypothetical protein A3F57_00050 [Candidatus Roizmanbacteria bacterium RIFCSPHIGHO2_12_FULL_36_11]OGK45099.1 MAG: hypothetical protein A3B40_05705 [Candidatus Roizmanbacteria bacterium RIFCSPLOWO2_01_FULL_37_16]